MTFKTLTLAVSVLILASSSFGAKLGEFCVYDDECQNDVPGPHSFCYWYDFGMGHCTCRLTDDASGTTCIVPPEKIGEECELERHCKFNLGPLARCSPLDRKCICTDGTSPIENGTLCVANKRVGEVCVAHEECPSAGEYGGCIILDPLSQGHKTCTCHCGSVPNEDNTACLQFRRLGWTCETTAQCQIAGCGDLCYCGEIPAGWTECLCEEGYVDDFWNGNKCVPKRENLGDECSVRGQCSWKMGGKSDCIDRKCACSWDAIPDYENNFCNPINETLSNKLL